MGICYVCEKPSETLLCCEECQQAYGTLKELATGIIQQERKPCLTAYSDMSLFEPVDLGKLEDLLDFEENATYVLPVCIEAIPAFNYTKILLVQTPHGGFAPNIENALEFQKVEDAREYIAQLREQYPDYNFQLWSKAALS